MTEVEKLIEKLNTIQSTKNDLRVLYMKWLVLKRKYDFKCMVCSQYSKAEKVKKSETVAACKAARKDLEDIEKKILKLK